MARVEIALPEKFLFTTRIPVRADDINFAQHLGNDRVLVMLQESRIQFFKWLGYDEADVEGTSMIMADSALKYISEGFHGDVLRFEISITEWSRCGFDIVYKLTNENSGDLLAVGKTGLVFFNYDTRKVQNVPDAFRSRIDSMIAELA